MLKHSDCWHAEQESHRTLTDTLEPTLSLRSCSKCCALLVASAVPTFGLAKAKFLLYSAPEVAKAKGFCPVVSQKWHCKCDLHKVVTRLNYQTLASTYTARHDQLMQPSWPHHKQSFECSISDAFDFMLHAPVFAAEASTSSGVVTGRQHVQQSCKLQNLGFLEGAP